jgi:hypothetical protein
VVASARGNEWGREELEPGRRRGRKGRGKFFGGARRRVNG